MGDEHLPALNLRDELGVAVDLRCHSTRCAETLAPLVWLVLAVEAVTCGEGAPSRETCVDVPRMRW